MSEFNKDRLTKNLNPIIVNQGKAISPSKWMYQTVISKHKQMKLLEHGYPDIEKTQYWSYGKLAAFQNARLRSIVEYAYANIPGYKRKFDNAGILPAEIQSTSDLIKLPITTRQELQDNEEFINQKLVSGTLYTGGSTGASLRYYESEISMIIRNEMHLRGWRWGGFQPYMKYCILTSAQQIQKDGDCIHLIGDLTDENLKHNMEIIQEFRPQHLRGFVGSLFILAKYCLDNNIRVEGMISIIPISENLYDYQRQIMEEAFNCEVFEEYCCNDGGACAWECEKREGLHYAMERAIIEEEQGRMIVTDLWNLAMPFIRYENGDSVQFLGEKCSCGRNLPLIKVKGRTNDIIITPYGVITPSFLLHHGIGLIGVDKCKPNFRSGFRAVQYVQKPGNILEVNIVKNHWCKSTDVDNFRKDLCEFVKGLQIKINYVENISTTKKGKRAFIINEDKDLLARYQDNPFIEIENKPANMILSSNENLSENNEHNSCNNNPRISVLLCVHNGQKHLSQALESIYNQIYQDFEFVIIDDASTDGTADILQQRKDARTFIHRNSENLGLTRSLNIGLSLCRGEYIARMDADDISLLERFEKQVKFLDENPDCAAVGSWCVRIDDTGRVISNWRHPTEYESIKESLLEKNSIFHGTAMIRSKSICKIGGYNEKYQYSQDYDLWLRMSESAKICNIGEFLYLSRCSLDSISNINKQQQNYFAELARQEARQRRNNILSLSEKNPAIDFFLAAQQEYKRGDFKSALQYMEKYKSVMDYSKLQRKVNNTKKYCDISVVIVTYNRGQELKQCLESLKENNNVYYETIVIDNGGADYDSIKDLVDQYVKCPVNFNLSEGRNIGAHFANGKILVFLDDDAVAESGYLDSIKAAFEQYDIYGLRGRTLPKNPPEYTHGLNIFNLGDEAFPSYCNQEGNSAFLREIYLSIGGMDPLLFGHEGSDLTYRIIRKYKNPALVIYWPDAIIYHDYPTQQKIINKSPVNRQNADYLKYKHNADILADRASIKKYPVSLRSDSGLQPKVSIIISCYNCEQFLPACIESIKAQSLQDWELFLLDDASTDGTAAAIDYFSRYDSRIKPFYFDDTKGPYIRRNYAIEQANSDFIVIQDADDIMHPDKLHRLYEEITQDANLGIMGSYYLSAFECYRGFEYADKLDLPVTHELIMEHYKSSLYICWHGSAIIRKSLFEDIGLYDETPYGSDKFWLAKAAEYARMTGKIRFKNIPEYLTYKIEHETSQQGTLPTLDPRSRRAGFQTYWLYKLMKIREKVQLQDGSIDIKAELKNCTCGDYIEKFGHLFLQQENALLDDAVLNGFTEKAVLQFNEDKYVSCIITLNSIEKILAEAAGRFKNYDLLRAMAFWAIGRKEKCLEYLNAEIRNHNNDAARCFYRDYFENNTRNKVDIWCQENAQRFGLQMVDTKAKTCITSEPLVSVIMPAYNAADYIAQAIESVLVQDYRNYELIVVNDGSTDNTEQIIKSYNDNRIRYYSQENRGPSAACNLGIKNSAGQYIIRLDSDDMMTPDFIRRHIEEFTQHPQADLVYCDDCLVDRQGRQIRVIERPEYSDSKSLISDLFRNGFPVVPFRTCIRRKVFDKIGFFDEDLIVGEDYDMMRRFVMNGLQIRHLKGALYIRRLTDDSLSRSLTAEKADSHFAVVERFIESFSYEDLFPNINWQEIQPEKRKFQSKCLIAETFLAIGKSYMNNKSSAYYQDKAFKKAKKHLSDALEYEPDNQQIRHLLNKFDTCRSNRNGQLQNNTVC